MASTVTKLRSSLCCINGLRRFSNAIPIPPPLDNTINHPKASSPSMVLPEHDNDIVPNSPFVVGDMELMAVPKKKVSPHKRGIRNGPKALKPVPVIIRCKCVLFIITVVFIFVLGSVVESNYHISFAAVELSLVMIRIVPTTDRLEVAHPT